MFYFGCLFFGLALVAFAAVFFWTKRDYVYDIRERYNLYIGTKDLTVSTPGGVTIGLAVSKTDQEVAWRVYTELATRVAIVDFNESYDSFFLVNESLHTLFGFVREQLGSIPIDRIRRDRSDEMVRFYMGILNDGIRPYLSKWHMPLSKWIETEKKKHPEATLYELEAAFPKRQEILADIQAMNQRMKSVGGELLKIVKAR